MMGRSLAQFRVTAKIGESGMGEVWQATDTKLDPVSLRGIAMTLQESKP